MKKMMFIALIILFIASYANANYITNGSFETPDISASGYSGWHVYADGVDSWLSLSGAGIEIQESGLIVTAQKGDQYVELDSDYRRGGDDRDGTTNSTMTQTVYLTIGSYSLDFFYQPRVNNNTQTNLIDFGIYDVFSSVANGSERSGWNEMGYIFDITADSNYDVFFSAGGTADSLGGFIDNVTLESAPVPEPATFILLGSGLAGLAFYRRKRK